MAERENPSFGSGMKLFRSRRRNVPAAVRSKVKVLSNSIARAFGTAESLTGGGTAIGIGRKLAPEISITGVCANGADACRALSKPSARSVEQTILKVETPI